MPTLPNSAPLPPPPPPPEGHRLELGDPLTQRSGGGGGGWPYAMKPKGAGCTLLRGAPAMPLALCSFFCFCCLASSCLVVLFCFFSLLLFVFCFCSVPFLVLLFYSLLPLLSGLLLLLSALLLRMLYFPLLLLSALLLFLLCSSLLVLSSIPLSLLLFDWF